MASVGAHETVAPSTGRMAAGVAMADEHPDGNPRPVGMTEGQKVGASATYNCRKIGGGL